MTQDREFLRSTYRMLFPIGAAGYNQAGVGERDAAFAGGLRDHPAAGKAGFRRGLMIVAPGGEIGECTRMRRKSIPGLLVAEKGPRRPLRLEPVFASTGLMKGHGIENAFGETYIDQPFAFQMDAQRQVIEFRAESAGIARHPCRSRETENPSSRSSFAKSPLSS